MDGGIVLQAAEAGVLEQVSKDKVKGLADVPEDTIKAGGKGGIPYRGSSVLLAYNAKTVATPPATFDELMTWIKANPGKFTYNSPKSGGSGGAFVTTVLDKYLPADTAKTLRTTYDKNLLTQWKPGWDARRTTRTCSPSGSRAGTRCAPSTRTSTRRASTPPATRAASNCSRAARSR